MWKQHKYEVRKKTFLIIIFSSVLSASRALSVHVLKLFCTATVPTSGASSTLKINKQRCSSYIKHSSPIVLALRKASTPLELTNKGLHCWQGCLGAAFPCQCCPGDPSHAVSGTVTCSTGTESCLEIRNVGECDSTSLASSKVVENPGLYFSKETHLWLVLLTLILSTQ